MANWNKRFIEAATFFSNWSKDESTKVGSVIYNPKTKSILSVGYNGFPRGVYESLEDNELQFSEIEKRVGIDLQVSADCKKKMENRHTRPSKYKYTVHAETNAIYNAARHGTALDGMGIALGWFPCSGCAGAIIQSGLSEVTCVKADIDHERWGEDFKISLEMFSEAGIKLIYCQ